MDDARHPVRGELLAVAVGVMFLLVVEIVVRVALGTSADQTHLDAVPASLDRAAASDADLIVLLGNSTTREGIDPDLLEDRLAEDDLTVDAVPIHPDDTTIADWGAVSAYFLQGRDPDLVVLSFVGAQLEDGLPRDLSRLTADFTGAGDLGERLADAHAVDDLAEIAGARVSDLYAHRADVADRLLDLLPEYRTVARRNNDAARAGGDGAATAEAPVCCTYDDMADLVAGIGADRVVVVALPERAGSPLDPALPEAVRATGARFIDARNVPGIDEDAFADPLHLNAAGRALMTRWLADRLPGS